MTDKRVAPQVAVRLNEDERKAVAEIAAALSGPRYGRMTTSTAIRTAIREFHATLFGEGTGPTS